MTSACAAGSFFDFKKDEGASKVANRIAVFDTNMGEFEIELFGDKTPITVKNFVDLAQDGFYDGVIFHRVIEGFMIQGGDPTGTGMGGPGYTIEDEFVKDLHHDDEGVLSMANTGRPHTGGSQFFITLAATPWLDGHHTVFGKVVKGMEVVREIGHVKTGAQDRPVHDVVINKITIRDAE
ncbi:MAG: peptidylprolyl isomerase [Anaerovibrio sp.]|nr:peptidylprolyl isomerase [Anaerovibrio sp.]